MKKYVRLFLIFFVSLGLGLMSFYLLFFFIPKNFLFLRFLRFPFKGMNVFQNNLSGIIITLLLATPYIIKFGTLDKDPKKDLRIQFLFVFIAVIIFLIPMFPFLVRYFSKVW